MPGFDETGRACIALGGCVVFTLETCPLAWIFLCLQGSKLFQGFASCEVLRGVFIENALLQDTDALHHAAFVRGNSAFPKFRA